jgi:iron-sulfur cluster repair protein YtfE (RIC family)
MAGRRRLALRHLGRESAVPPNASSKQSRDEYERQSWLAQQARQQYDVLLTAMHQLEAALADAAPGREPTWLGQVDRMLIAVMEALGVHIRATEEKDGLLAAIDAGWPNLQHRVERLRQEHGELMEHGRALQKQIGEYAADEAIDYKDLRRRAAMVLTVLRHHQAIENDLIFETFVARAGGERQSPPPPKGKNSGKMSAMQ